MENKIHAHIVISTSPNWVRYLPIQLHSIVRNMKSDIKYTFHILTDELEEKDKISCFKVIDKMNKVMSLENNIKFYNVESLFHSLIYSDINITTRFTRYTLYRLLIPSLLEEDKVLYLDSDIIVCQDISGLFKLDISDYLWCGCIDTGVQITHKQSIGMGENTPYFNAGVGLLNLKHIREMGLDKIWFEEINTKEYLGLDQDLWNKTMSHKSIILDSVYNCSVSTRTDISFKDIKIMHFAGATKPWNDYTVFNSEIWRSYNSEYELLY